MLNRTTGHASMAGELPRLHVKQRLLIYAKLGEGKSSRRVQAGTNCHKKGAPHVRGN